MKDRERRITRTPVRGDEDFLDGCAKVYDKLADAALPEHENINPLYVMVASARLMSIMGHMCGFSYLRMLRVLWTAWGEAGKMVKVKDKQ